MIYKSLYCLVNRSDYIKLSWERMPCPVRNSLAKPMTNPNIAKRPFQFSANLLKPNLDS